MVDPLALRRRVLAIRTITEETLQMALDLEVGDASVARCVQLIANLDAMVQALDEIVQLRLRRLH